jgi:uncharacterized protein DUF5681
MRDDFRQQTWPARGATTEAGEKPNNAGKKQDGRFKKGQSGNPCGMRRGSHHRATLAAEKPLDGEAQELTRKCIDLAKNGDTRRCGAAARR